MNFTIIIPARFFSLRFPKKLLADIHGKPMIIRVIEKALTTTADKVIIATDHRKIIEIIESEYGCDKNRVEVCLTQSTHQSGMERLSEVVERYKLSDNQYIVHLQADEPLISSYMIHQVVKSLYMSSHDISVTTLVTPIFSFKEFQDNNVVKVVINVNNDALYFSRSPIPWNDMSNNIDFSTQLLRHIGIYSYRVNFVRRYMTWVKSPLEKLENLEQLRVLWYGEKIRVSIINKVLHISVDTSESLKRVNELFLNKNC